VNTFSLKTTPFYQNTKKRIKACVFTKKTDVVGRECVKGTSFDNMPHLYRSLGPNFDFFAKFAPYSSINTGEYAIWPTTPILQFSMAFRTAIFFEYYREIPSMIESSILRGLSNSREEDCSLSISLEVCSGLGKVLDYRFISVL
jgi:hypothetical protein